MSEPSNVPWNEGTFGSSPSAVNLAAIIRDNPQTHHQASKFSCFWNKFRAALRNLEDVQDISTREMLGELLYQTKKESVAKLDVETVPEFKTHCLCVLAGVWREWKRNSCTPDAPPTQQKWRSLGDKTQHYLRETLVTVDHQNGKNLLKIDAYPCRINLTSRDVEKLVQMMLEADEPMEYSLLDRLEELEKENTALKQQNAELDDKVAVLEAEKEYISHQLNKVNAEHIRLQLDAQRTEFLLNNELEAAQKATEQAKESARIWRNAERELAIDLEESREDTRLWRGHWEEERVARKKAEEKLAELRAKVAAYTNPYIVHDEIDIKFDTDNKLSLVDCLQQQIMNTMSDALSFIPPIEVDAPLPTSWKNKAEKVSPPAPQKYRAWAKEMEKYRESRQKRS